MSIRGLAVPGQMTVSGLQGIAEGEGNRVGGRNANKGIKEERFRDGLTELCGSVEELNKNGRVWAALRVENPFRSQVCLYIRHSRRRRNNKDPNALYRT